MTKPKNPKPKKLPRRTMTMADKADDGKRNHSVGHTPTSEPLSTSHNRARNDANAMWRTLDDEADDTELAEAVALEMAIDEVRTAKQRAKSLHRAITGGMDNGALVLACVLAVCAFAVVLVAIAAMYAPERGTPYADFDREGFQRQAPIIVCAQGPCTRTDAPTPTTAPTLQPCTIDQRVHDDGTTEADAYGTCPPQPTVELPSVGDHPIPSDLHCPEDALILPVYGGTPGALAFECVAVDDFTRNTAPQQ